MHGTVLTGRNNIFTVLTDGEEYLCRLRGKTLTLEERAYNPLAPGDTVDLADPDPLHHTAVITARRPRSSAFQRYNHKREALQTLAANIELVVVVASAYEPAFRQRFVDRVLALARHHELDAIVAITKSDLRPDIAEAESARYRGIGYQAFALREDAPQSDEPLLARLETARSVLVGQSGVGKSTLLNRLVGEELQKTGTISARYHRGRHTTNASVLIRQGNLEIVDTPGIRELDCRHIPADELDLHFIDLAPYAYECRLGDCRHGEEPDCAVREAVESGSLDRERYESYLRLLEEIVELQEEDQ